MFNRESLICRFGVLPYLNAAPLVHFLPKVCLDAEFVCRIPREMLAELAGSRVDAAIVPVVDYLMAPELQMVDGLGISAGGKVESVLLQCKRPLKEVKTVNLDPASKTSNLLAKLLLKKHFCVRQEIRFCDGASEPDASVVIGDRALRAKQVLESYDLADEWKSMTGLPFVFAVWAHRKDHPDAWRLPEILHAAKDAGLGAIDELSRLHAKRLGLPESRCRHYLTCRIHYDVGPSEKRGMQLFRELCRDLLATHGQEIKEERTRTRRIVRDERKHRAIAPVLAQNR